MPWCGFDEGKSQKVACCCCCLYIVPKYSGAMWLKWDGYLWVLWGIEHQYGANKIEHCHLFDLLCSEWSLIETCQEESSGNNCQGDADKCHLVKVENSLGGKMWNMFICCVSKQPNKFLSNTFVWTWRVKSPNLKEGTSPSGYAWWGSTLPGLIYNDSNII